MILLECGCRILSRVEPTPNARLSCNSGSGHGYSLGWITSTQPNGTVSTNRNLYKE
jgi:hypothetical protein